MIHILTNISLSQVNYNNELNKNKQNPRNNGCIVHSICEFLEKNCKNAIRKVYPSAKDSNNKLSSLLNFGRPSDKITSSEYKFEFNKQRQFT